MSTKPGFDPGVPFSGLMLDPVSVSTVHSYIVDTVFTKPMHFKIRFLVN